jgi:hypothetical protein
VDLVYGPVDDMDSQSTVDSWPGAVSGAPVLRALWPHRVGGKRKRS